MANDPQAVFKFAEVFRAAALVLSKQIGEGHLELMLPTGVNGAFSLELHLKSLILLEGSTYGRIHDLDKLFFALTPESQKAIRASYEPKRLQTEAGYATLKNIPVPKADFDSVLQASAKAFEHFRYAFDGALKEGEGWLAGEIGECVRARILELRPDWGK
jgi:hypothetical protein